MTVSDTKENDGTTGMKCRELPLCIVSYASLDIGNSILDRYNILLHNINIYICVCIRNPSTVRGVLVADPAPKILVGIVAPSHPKPQMILEDLALRAMVETFTRSCGHLRKKELATWELAETRAPWLLMHIPSMCARTHTCMHAHESHL